MLGGAKYFTRMDCISGFWQLNVNQEDQEKIEEKHICNLKLVFYRLRVANLKLKPENCNFMLKTVNYFGHVIPKDEIHPDKDKIAMIKEYPAPKTVKEICQFIELRLPRKRSRSNGTKEAKAFSELSEFLCDKPVLKYPDFSLPFLVTCDSAATTMGAVLSQKINGSEHPMYFVLRQINKAERNYSTTERECLCKFTIVTDHRPLWWLLQIKEPMSHLARWSLLSEYDFDIVHTARKGNANADALSRIPVQFVTPLYEPMWDRELIRQEQERDTRISVIRCKVETGEKAGVKHTYELIKLMCFWEGMYTDVTEFCANFESCSIHKCVPNNKLASLQKF
ncbi:hypothetical protein PR048_010289 [Dryococelus australis]|uniref:RNA-directed DNA polymerase n=1 Tax=Dryococelus australis TaxID=614101 RepID=A0ABQ9I2B1_9NEOP|nr:hypothetical protein PR048_010289 [Dryococelus australis]